MDDTTIDERRAQAYTGLAVAFDRPGDDLEAALADGRLVQALADVGDALENPSLQAAAADLSSVDTDHHPLATAYATHFGLESGGDVSIYELAYSPGSLVTNTDQLADIAGFYRAFGLDLPDGARDRADALPIQLEFVGFLAMRRAQYRVMGDDEALDIVTDATAAFLEDHLGRWLPRFVETARDAVDHPAYLALLDALSSLLAEDLERFDAEPIVFEETPTAPLESITDFDDAEGRLELSCGAASPCATPHPTPEQ